MATSWWGSGQTAEVGLVLEWRRWKLGAGRAREHAALAAGFGYVETERKIALTISGFP